MAKGISQKTANGSALDFEARLGAAAGKMRAHHADLVPVRKDLNTTPFNLSDWGGENLRQKGRREFGTPPVNNATKNLLLEQAMS
jgi:hypothetical protein